MTARAALGLVALALLGGCHKEALSKPQGQGAAMNKDDAARGELRSAIQAALSESRMHFSIDSLPSRERLRAAAAGPWAELSPLERFFVFAVSPEAAQAAGPEAVAGASCAALAALPADWWGEPGPPATAAARQLAGLGEGAAPCLRALLSDGRPLRFKEGESNAMARDLGRTVADQAAALLAVVRGEAYDARAAAPVRSAARERLR